MKWISAGVAVIELITTQLSHFIVNMASNFWRCMIPAQALIFCHFTNIFCNPHQAQNKPVLRKNSEMRSKKMIEIIRTPTIFSAEIGM